MTSSGPGLVSVSVQFLYLVTKLNRTEPFNGKQKPNQTEPNHVWKIKTKPNRTVYELSSHLNQTIIFSFHHLCFFPSLLPFFLSQWRIIITRLLLATRISSVIASNSSSIATSRSSRPSSSLQRIPPTTPSPSSE